MPTFSREPVVYVNLVKAILTLLTAFGVAITNDQTSAILGFVSIAVIFLIGGKIERDAVTPVAAPVLPATTQVTTPAGAAAVVVEVEDEPADR